MGWLEEGNRAERNRSLLREGQALYQQGWSAADIWNYQFYGIRPKSKSVQTHENTQSIEGANAQGNAQAAEEASMARRARGYGQLAGQPAPTETPVPYNSPTTTPEFRNVRPSNHPGPVGPTPSQNGKI